MPEIINKTSEMPQANAIFLQPTRDCVLNCKGCYVKAHGRSHKQTPVGEQTILLEELIEANPAICNQFTLSADTPSPELSNRDDHMLCVFFKTICAFKTIASPEIHITIKDPKTLMTYLSCGYEPKYLRRLALISFSRLDREDSLHPDHAVIDAIRTHCSDTKIAWNLRMPAREPTKSNIKSWINNVRMHHTKIDQIYMLLTKTPVGAKRDSTDFDQEKRQIARDLYYMKALQKVANEEGWGNKLIVDGCLQDVLKFKDTGFGCSSNISKFQVWPDGTVTGCPYKFRSRQEPAMTAEGILENIKEARNHYDFDECHLPGVLESVTT
jgi:hypothetical protein